MYFVTKTPNFTIVLPGGCNGYCAFCFTKGRMDESMLLQFPEYRDRLSDVLNKLPAEIGTISLSGGEPLLSPCFDLALETIRTANRRFQVVLTTNGTSLLTHVRAGRLDGVDHVNISRHAAEDKANRTIFGTRKVPSGRELRTCVRELEKRGIDTTLNCVIKPSSTKDATLAMIRFATWSGAIALCFRFEYENSIAPDLTKIEKMFQMNPTILEASCPVCRSRVQTIGGFRVVWKHGVREPTSLLSKNDLYELVFQPDGILTADWAGRIPVTLPVKKLTQSKPQIITAGNNYEFDCHPNSIPC